MTVIGTFVSSKEGGWIGGIHTLTIKARLRFVPNDNRENENAPAFRVFVGRSRVGDAWQATSSGEQPNVRRERIFALGNSEGTLHALNYQVHDPDLSLAGLVLTGPPGRSVGAVSRAQLDAQAKSFPNGEQLLALYDAAVARFLAGEPAAPDPALPEGVRTLIAALESPYNLPFARELWSADAAAPLSEVRVPVLVIIGKKDLQVDWQADAGPLQRAAAGLPDVSFFFPENANHVLKHESRPREELAQGEAMQRYNAADAELDLETVRAIVAWLTGAQGED